MALQEKWQMAHRKNEAAKKHVGGKRKPVMAADIRYEIIIYWSETDQAFVAEVPELAGCAADGLTYQQALANVEVVIREWIETARELGRPIPEPRGRLMYA
jgi:predicted RNase H-like HicB family nuclease